MKEKEKIKLAKELLNKIDANILTTKRIKSSLNGTLDQLEIIIKEELIDELSLNKEECVKPIENIKNRFIKEILKL